MYRTYIVKATRFEKEEWDETYLKYLNNLYTNEEKCINPYNDPDIIEYHTEFYKDLTKFLNQREKDIKNVLKERWTYEFDIEKAGINVIDDKKQYLFTIFSDQFGFSAPRRDKKIPNRAHPYDVYAKVTMDENGKLEEKALKLISDCVYYSRTLGGSFLWPINGGKGPNGYNPARGGTTISNENHYIEDRVDLTLLEIKKYYEEKLNNKDILNRYLTDEMKKWLDHFKSFENYVEFFCFDGDFVYKDKDYGLMPKPLNEDLNNINDILNGRRWKRIMIGREEEINSKNKEYIGELKETFIELIKRIKSRTEKMEKIKNKKQF